MGATTKPSYAMAGIIHASCARCAHWVRNYEVTPITVKRGLPVMNSSVTGWCLLDVPPIAHPQVTGWNEVRQDGEGFVGIETRDTSVCPSFEE